MNHKRLEAITLLISTLVLLLTISCSLVGTTETPLPATTSAGLPATTRTPLSGEIERLALNDAETQDSGGVAVTVLRVLFGEMEDVRASLPERVFSSREWEGVLVAGEIILQIENTTDKIAAIYPWQDGIVVVGSEQITPSSFAVKIGSLDHPDGEIYPGHTKIAGFWFGLHHTSLADISSVLYMINAPSDEAENALGPDYRFEIDLSSKPNDPLPDFLSTSPSPTPSGSEETVFHLPGEAGIAVGPDGSFYTVDRSDGIVYRYTASGEDLEHWWWYDYLDRDYVDLYHYYSDSSGSGEVWRLTGDLAEASIIGVDVASDGRLYVLSDGGHVFRFTASGAFIESWGESGDAPGQFSMPMDIAIAPDGTVYVADDGNDRIQCFTATGDFSGMWGSSGTDPGQLQGAAGTDVAPDGSVYVADYAGIHHFTAGGTFIERWGWDPDSQWDFGMAQDVAVGPDGTVYVANAHGQIQRFTSSGEFIGSWQLPGKEPGQFALPMSVAVAPDGTVYVRCNYDPEWSGNLGVQHFTADGELLKMW